MLIQQLLLQTRIKALIDYIRIKGLKIVKGHQDWKNYKTIIKGLIDYTSSKIVIAHQDSKELEYYIPHPYIQASKC